MWNLSSDRAPEEEIMSSIPVIALDNVNIENDGFNSVPKASRSVLVALFSEYFVSVSQL